MIESSKGHWVNGFEKHPDEKFANCTPCLGIDGIYEQMSNRPYISIGDDIVKPWFQKT